jgi:hypothetical protein
LKEINRVACQSVMTLSFYDVIFDKICGDTSSAEQQLHSFKEKHIPNNNSSEIRVVLWELQQQQQCRR